MKWQSNSDGLLRSHLGPVAKQMTAVVLSELSMGHKTPAPWSFYLLGSMGRRNYKQAISQSPQDPLRRTAVLCLGKRYDQSPNKQWILIRWNVWNPHLSLPFGNTSSLPAGSETNTHIPACARVDHLQTFQPKKKCFFACKRKWKIKFYGQQILKRFANMENNTPLT